MSSSRERCTGKKPVVKFEHLQPERHLIKLVRELNRPDQDSHHSDRYVSEKALNQTRTGTKSTELGQSPLRDHI